jgi:hypothetical protein
MLRGGEVDMDDDEVMIGMSTGEDGDNYFAEVQQPKESKALVLVVTMHGTKQFMKDLVYGLKSFDFDDENGNYISVQDIHGDNALKPDYELPDNVADEERGVKN